MPEEPIRVGSVLSKELVFYARTCVSTRITRSFYSAAFGTNCELLRVNPEEESIKPKVADEDEDASKDIDSDKTEGDETEVEEEGEEPGG